MEKRRLWTTTTSLNTTGRNTHDVVAMMPASTKPGLVLRVAEHVLFSRSRSKHACSIAIRQRAGHGLAIRFVANQQPDHLRKQQRGVSRYLA